MTTTTTSKKVRRFCVGDIDNQLVPKEGYEFLETKTYHGDRDEIWIEIYDEKGNLKGKWNTRFVIGIDYE